MQQQQWQALHRITNLVSRLVVSVHDSPSPNGGDPDGSDGHHDHSSPGTSRPGTPYEIVRHRNFVNDMREIREILNSHWREFAAPGTVQVLQRRSAETGEIEDLEFPENIFMFKTEKSASRAPTRQSSPLPTHEDPEDYQNALDEAEIHRSFMQDDVVLRGRFRNRNILIKLGYDFGGALCIEFNDETNGRRYRVDLFEDERSLEEKCVHLLKRILGIP